MAAKYRAAIIGHTGVGNYGHDLERVYQDMPEVDVVAVADPDQQGRQTVGAQLGVAHLYADYREMLTKEDVDLVNVCPRAVGGHPDMVIASVEAGAKGIFCEKPLAASLVEVDAMLAACEQRQVRVAVAHRRANPYEQHGKKMVDAGQIGQVQAIRARGKFDHRAGGEDLAVLGPHMMDSMRYFAGANVAWVHGHVTQDGRSVTAADAYEGNEGIGFIAGNGIAAYFAFENGVAGHFDSYLGDSAEKRNSRWFGFEVYGTEGIISLRNSPNGEMYLYRHGMWIPDEAMGQWEQVHIEEWDNIPARERTHHSNQLIAKELIQAIEEKRDVVYASSGPDAQAALEMIMAVHESERVGGRVTMPLVNRENPYAVWRRQGRE